MILASVGSVWYIRLLAELDLLKDVSRSDEEDSQSLDDISYTSFDQGDDVDGPIQGIVINAVSGDASSASSSHSTHSNENHLKSVSRGSSRAQSPQPGGSLHPSPCHTRSPSLTAKPYTLTAKIIDTEIVREGSKSHAIYIVCVMRKDASGQEELWHVFRRYSEFHDFHLSITSKFIDLSSVSFPSKRMLNNLAAWFLEKRKSELDEWLQTILAPPTLQSHPGLQEIIQRFLDQTTYSTSPLPNIAKRGDENIPLRILLLLMDEVFDLRSKDQWFRRRIMLFLRQILKAMFGDIVNRRIVDYVAYITSPEQVADYVKTFKESFWPNGDLAPQAPERDSSMKMRTRVAARTSMLASISDELKAILGSQTTTRGVLGVYDTVQWTALNKRLVYVLLEGIIESILSSQKQIPPLLRSLHTGSARIAARNAPHSRKVRTER